MLSPVYGENADFEARSLVHTLFIQLFFFFKLMFFLIFGKGRISFHFPNIPIEANNILCAAHTLVHTLYFTEGNKDRH